MGSFWEEGLNMVSLKWENNLSGEINLTKDNIPWGINFANIGGKKGDRYIQKNIKSVFSFDASGNVTEKINISFEHNGTRNLHSDRYFGYVRIVKPAGVTLENFTNSANYMNKPQKRETTFPNTSEFDFFVFVDPSSEENIELKFIYPKNIFHNSDTTTFDIFMQPGLINLPVKFVFQAFADSQIKIDTNQNKCENITQRENISTCTFTAPNSPKNITIVKKEDTTLPIFEDVEYKNDGKIIRIQFSEELSPIEKSDIFIIKKQNNENIAIKSITNQKRAIEIELETPLSATPRSFYTILINGLSDITGNNFEQYNSVIAYPKYK